MMSMRKASSVMAVFLSSVVVQSIPLRALPAGHVGAQEGCSEVLSLDLLTGSGFADQGDGFKYRSNGVQSSLGISIDVEIKMATSGNKDQFEPTVSSQGFLLLKVEDQNKKNKEMGVDVMFSYYEAGTNNPFVASRIAMAFYDLDKKEKIEIVTPYVTPNGYLLGNTDSNGTLINNEGIVRTPKGTAGGTDGDDDRRERFQANGDYCPDKYTRQLDVEEPRCTMTLYYEGYSTIKFHTRGWLKLSLSEAYENPNTCTSPPASPPVPSTPPSPPPSTPPSPPVPSTPPSPPPSTPPSPPPSTLPPAPSTSPSSDNDCGDLPGDGDNFEQARHLVDCAIRKIEEKVLEVEAKIPSKAN